MTSARDLTFVLGGARSGKSGYAERLATAATGSVTYIATAQRGGDAEFTARIARHRERRPAHWQLIEADHDLAGALAQADVPGACVLIDCLTLWLAALLCPIERDAPRDDCSCLMDRFMAALEAPRARLIVVSNEIGWGVVPLGAATRLYVDELGRLNQRVATAATQVTLMVAGLPVAVKP